MNTRRAKLDELHHDPANARKHDQRNLDAIAASLAQFGQVEPLVVQKSTGRVIGGNGRLEVLRKMGKSEADIVELDIDGTQAAALAIALNRTAELATWDDETLAQLLDTLPSDLRDAAGYNEGELRGLLDSLRPEVTEDEAPEPLPDPVSRTGDLWECGGHRVLCGDSTKAEDVARLMECGRADLCFTSPPYNAGDNRLGGNSSMVESKYVGTNDDKAEDEYGAFLREFTNAALDHCAAAVVNIQQLAGNKRVVLRWLAENSGRFVDLAIWDKQSAPPQMSANVLNSQHELLVILAADPDPTRAIPFADWHGTISTIYAGAGQKDRDAAALHAATMPIHLPSWVLGTLCPKADVIYDPFLGSGTTLIACEQLGRRCYAIEIEPRYIDVAVRRWQNLTGKAATLNGKTFAEVAAERGVAV